MSTSVYLSPTNLFNLISRRSSATADKLNEHKALIEIATEDLADHLDSIDEKLETIFEQRATGVGTDSMRIRAIKEEKLSTERSLQICGQLLEHINQIRLSATDQQGFPGSVINEGLQNCRDSLAVTAAKLENHMKDLMDRMVAKSKSAMTSEDDIADLARLREAWETTRQCMHICSTADDHLDKNVSVIENYAIGDAVQFMVSTNGKTLRGKNQGHGWRTRQVGGHLNDETVVQISRDMSGIGLEISGNAAVPPRGDPAVAINAAATQAATEANIHGKQSSKVWKAHGRGYTLDVATSASDSVEKETKFPPNQSNLGRPMS